MRIGLQGLPGWATMARDPMYPSLLPYSPERDVYRLLQVHPNANDEEITAACRRLARTFHPDRNRSNRAHEEMQVVNAVRHLLTDPRSRAAYDGARRRYLYEGYRPLPQEYRASAQPHPQRRSSRSSAPPSRIAARAGAALRAGAACRAAGPGGRAWPGALLSLPRAARGRRSLLPALRALAGTHRAAGGLTAGAAPRRQETRGSARSGSMPSSPSAR